MAGGRRPESVRSARTELSRRDNCRRQEGNAPTETSAAPFVDLVTLHDTVGDLSLTPGTAVRIRVRARNAAGESGPSPVAEVLVPVAAAA